MEKTLDGFEEQCHLLLKETSMINRQSIVFLLNFKNSGELGIIRLNGLTADQVAVSQRQKKNFFMFEIKTPNRTYFLCADTEKERTSWMDVIKLSIAGKAGFPTGNGSSNGKKIGVEDFDLLHVIGKGSFGKV